MAVSITWSINAHKKETSGNNYVSNVEWRCTAKEGNDYAASQGVIKLDRPSSVTPYADFLGSGDAALVAAVKTQMGTDKVAEMETKAKEELEKSVSPPDVWVEGPA